MPGGRRSNKKKAAKSAAATATVAIVAVTAPPMSLRANAGMQDCAHQAIERCAVTTTGAPATTPRTVGEAAVAITPPDSVVIRYDKADVDAIASLTTVTPIEYDHDDDVDVVDRYNGNEYDDNDAYGETNDDANDDDDDHGDPQYNGAHDDDDDQYDVY